jgi:hypothetical protein
MEKELKLYLVIIGCKPKGRFTEQHDVFFGIANSLKELLPEMKAFWPEANGRIHVDSWREITTVENHSVTIEEKNKTSSIENNLFFINLGGYKENDLEEYHYKIITVGKTLSDATKKAKQTAFYKHCGFKGATSHIDDKYGIDIDDIYNVNDMLAAHFKEQYSIKIIKSETTLEQNPLHIGYIKLSKLLK